VHRIVRLSFSVYLLRELVRKGNNESSLLVVLMELPLLNALYSSGNEPLCIPLHAISRA